jgi:hypothetical protein
MNAETTEYAHKAVYALRSIQLGPDGLPNNPDQRLAAYLAYQYANGLRARIAREPGPVAAALRTLCTAYLDMVNAHRDGNRHPEWGLRWLAALASIPDLFPSQPVADTTVWPDAAAPLTDPRVQAMIAADPELLGFIGQALAADVEQ